MTDPAQIPIRSSTQDHLDIEDIKDDLVILKNGSCCLILQTNAVNFNLLSESEQDATIYAYAGLLNSLNFPIQIFIRSRQKDISSYLLLLKKQKEKTKSEKLKEQIKKYQSFIEKTVKENEVLDKKFYIVIPFSNLEMGISQGLKHTAFSQKKGLPFPKEYILDKAKTKLYPKRDHIIRQFSRLGLKTIQLTTRGLVELFYNIYNSEGVGQKLSPITDYTAPLVNTAISQETIPLQQINQNMPSPAPMPKTPLPEITKKPIVIPEKPMAALPKAKSPKEIENIIKKAAK